MEFSTNNTVMATLSPRSRSYKRPMKPRLPRKITSSARINLNRFWNELEEFYTRFDAKKSKNNNNDLFANCDYTTDTFDHEFEAEQNLVNERLLRQEQEEQENKRIHEESRLRDLRVNSHQRRLQSQDICSEDDLSEEDEDGLDDEDEGDKNNCLNASVWANDLHNLPSPPPMPKSLIDIFQMISRH